MEIAKAQVQLDSDQLEDAQQELARISGDNRAQIQREHAAREDDMRKYEGEAHTSGQVAIVVADRIGTLAGRVGAWSRQRTRYQLLQQAIGKAQTDIIQLTEDHNTLETDADKGAGSADTQD